MIGQGLAQGGRLHPVVCHILTAPLNRALCRCCVGHRIFHPPRGRVDPSRQSFDTMQHFAEPCNRSPWRDAFCRIWPSAATARRSSRCSTTCPAKSSSNTMTGTARSAHRCSAIAHSPFWAFLVLAAFILLFALLRLHAATLTFSILNLLLCALYAGILIFILVSASHEMDVVRSTASQPGLNLANDLSFSLVPSYGMYAIIAGTLFMFVGAIVSVVNRSHARKGGIRQSGSGESARSRVRWHAGAKLRSRAGRRSGVSAACRAI